MQSTAEQSTPWF